MIVLYQFPAKMNLPNTSPFCMKIETYLHMTHLPFQIKSVLNPARSPKGKLPFIKDNGKVIADSSFIIDYLKATYGDSIDQNLTPLQKAQALAMQRLLEDHLYWVMLYAGWIDEPGARIFKKELAKVIPWGLKNLILNRYQRKIKKELIGQGIGLHTRDEIYALGERDLQAIDAFLADKPYMQGPEPSSLDAITYSFLQNILVSPIPSPLKIAAQRYPALAAYCKRMTNDFYPSYLSP